MVELKHFRIPLKDENVGGVLGKIYRAQQVSNFFMKYLSKVEYRDACRHAVLKKNVSFFSRLIESITF